MINKKSIIIVTFFTSLQLFSQSKYIDIVTNFGVPIDNNIMTYTIYPNNFNIGIECNSYENCNNQHPEQILMSIISASNFEWDKKNFNYLITENSKKYDYVKKIDMSKYYFKLLRKLTFVNNGKKYAIIKYHIRENMKILPMCNVFIFENGKWYVINSEGSISKAYIMFTYLSIKSLDCIFKKEKLNIISFDKQIEEIYNDNILNFSKAINSSSNSKTEEKDLRIVLDETFFDQSINDNEENFKLNQKLNFEKLNSILINANYI